MVATFEFQKIKLAADGHLGYTIIVVIATGLLIDVMFGSSVRLRLDFYGPSYTHC